MGNAENSDEISFLSEDEKLPDAAAAWKILIADDQEEVHLVTKLALKGMTFLGRPVQFLSAYGAAEAEKVLWENPDIALALVDIVMEDEDSGFSLVQTIREKMNNHLIRVILRTGLPDVMPEKEIMERYDINDYRSKTELTAPRLYSIVLSSLRTYSLLYELEWKRLEYQHLSENLEKTVQERTAELQSKEEMLQSIMDASLTPMVIIKICGGQVMFVNRKGAELYGEPIEQVLGKYDYLTFSDLEKRFKLYGEIMRDGHVEDVEVMLSIREGKPFWALFSAVKMIYNNEICLLFYFVDITKRKEMEGELRRLATTDALTGIYNRGYFLEYAQKEISRAARTERGFSILMFDLDKFKNVNDTYGHPVGDEVLKAFARMCQENLRPMDLFARLGGEEFVAMLPETSSSSAKEAAERLRSKAEKLTIPVQGGEVRFTVSIGIASYDPSTSENLAAVMKRADAALYQAKEEGRNLVRIYGG